MDTLFKTVLPTAINTTARHVFVGAPEGTGMDYKQHLFSSVVGEVLNDSQKKQLKKVEKLQKDGIPDAEYQAYIGSIKNARKQMDNMASRHKPTSRHVIQDFEMVRDNLIYDRLVEHAELLFPSHGKTAGPTAAGVTPPEKTIIPVQKVEYKGDKPVADFAILYLHGGAYTLGSPKSHRGFALAFSRLTSAPVYLPHYSLAPENPYPAGLSDCLSVYMELLAKHPNIVVMGDSAGGGMTMAVTSYLRDEKKPLPKAICLLSPWVDLTFSDPANQLHVYDYLPDSFLVEKVVSPSTPPQMLEYCRDDQATDPYISPLITGNFNGFPPVLIHTGSVERLTCQDVALGVKMNKEGVEVRCEVYNGGFHVFQGGTGRLAQYAIQQIASFCTVQNTGFVWVKKVPNKQFSVVDFDPKTYLRDKIEQVEALAKIGASLATKDKDVKMPPISKAFWPPWKASSKKPIQNPPFLNSYKILISN